jgi:hypothetical protein
MPGRNSNAAFTRELAFQARLAQLCVQRDESNRTNFAVGDDLPGHLASGDRQTSRPALGFVDDATGQAGVLLDRDWIPVLADFFRVDCPYTNSVVTRFQKVRLNRGPTTHGRQPRF